MYLCSFFFFNLYFTIFISVYFYLYYIFQRKGILLLHYISIKLLSYRLLNKTTINLVGYLPTFLFGLVPVANNKLGNRLKVVESLVNCVRHKCKQVLLSCGTTNDWGFFNLWVLLSSCYTFDFKSFCCSDVDAVAQLQIQFELNFSDSLM